MAWYDFLSFLTSCCCMLSNVFSRFAYMLCYVVRCICWLFTVWCLLYLFLMLCNVAVC
ncbi:hypothetical protein BS17DRAFT_529336 [Gyrodon lividus]|nr:hypothetical protein BS17DRAFT_529336 [Gyrodon lividus]